MHFGLLLSGPLPIPLKLKRKNNLSKAPYYKYVLLRFWQHVKSMRAIKPDMKLNKRITVQIENRHCTVMYFGIFFLYIAIWSFLLFYSELRPTTLSKVSNHNLDQKVSDWKIKPKFLHLSNFESLQYVSSIQTKTSPHKDYLISNKILICIVKENLIAPRTVFVMLWNWKYALNSSNLYLVIQTHFHIIKLYRNLD